jgi:hypothetical protein
MARLARLTALAVLFLVIAPPPAHAGFHQVAREVERSGQKRTFIPMIGVARVAVWVIRPHGVSDFKLAVFEGKGTRKVSAEHLAAIVERSTEKGWQQVVKSVKPATGEHTYILARVEKRRVRMLVIAIERQETAVVELAVNPDRFASMVEKARNGEPFSWR